MKRLCLVIAVLLAIALPAQALAADAFSDGTYTVEVALEGGSGRASVKSPAKLTIANGGMTAVIIWSSSNYTYMEVNGIKYDPLNSDGNSAFEIPVAALDADIAIRAETIAMSEPHVVEYTLRFDSGTLKQQSAEGKPPVVVLIIIAAALTVIMILVFLHRGKHNAKKQ